MYAELKESFKEGGCKVTIEGGHMTIYADERIKLKRKLDEFSKDNAADIVLQVGPNKSKIQAHKEILKREIPYFTAMFSDNFQESNLSVIDLGEDLDPTAATKLIDFVYKGSLHVWAPDIQNIFQLADQWGLTNLKKLCSSFMIRELDATNCLGLLDLAEMHCCEDLIKPCQHVISQQFQALSFTTAFLLLSPDSLSRVLDLENINSGPCGEDFILSSVMHWFKYDKESRKNNLAETLQHVRVSKVSEEAKRKFLEDPETVQLTDVQRRLSCQEEEQERQYEENFIVICGYLQSRTGPSCPKTTAVEKFDPSKEQFVTLERLPKAPSYGKAFNLMGRVVFVAVYVSTDSATNQRVEHATVWTYNTWLNSWSETQDLFSSVALDHIVNCLVNGGSVVHCAQKQIIYAVMVEESVCISVQCVDGEIFCDKKSTLPCLLSKLDETHCGLQGVAHKGCLYVMGGYFGPEMERAYSNMVLMLSSDALQWETKAEMAIPRTDFSVVSCDNKIIITGGYGGDEHQRRRQQSCETYDVESNQWSTFPQLVQSRSHHCTVVVNRKLYTIGGKSYASQKIGMAGWHPGGARIVSDYVEYIDPSLANSGMHGWLRLTKMAKSRCNFSTVVV